MRSFGDTCLPTLATLSVPLLPTYLEIGFAENVLYTVGLTNRQKQSLGRRCGATKLVLVNGAPPDLLNTTISEPYLHEAVRRRCKSAVPLLMTNEADK